MLSQPQIPEEWRLEECRGKCCQAGGALSMGCGQSNAVPAKATLTYGGSEAHTTATSTSKSVVAAPEKSSEVIQFSFFVSATEPKRSRLSDHEVRATGPVAGRAETSRHWCGAVRLGQARPAQVWRARNRPTTLARSHRCPGNQTETR